MSLHASLIELSQEKLKYHLYYDPETGEFIWVRPTNNGINAGDIAGHIDDSKGYVTISLFGQHYYAHNLAWFYVYGVWKRIDHKNGHGINNKLLNLRPATTQQNNRNARVRIDNILQIKGVTKMGVKYIARIFVDGRSIYLGSHDTIEEAVNARREAELKYFGEFSRTET